MKPTAWIGLLLALVAGASVAQDSNKSSATSLDEVKQAYETQMTQTETDCQEDVTKLITLYKAGLIKLKKSLQTAGDFDGVVAVDTEYKRCDDEWDGTLDPADIVETPVKMKTLQKQYLSRYTAVKKDKSKAIVDLSTKYKVNLLTLRKTLIKSDRIDEAKLVNDEIDAVSADERVTDAQSELEAARPKPKNTPAPATTNLPATTSASQGTTSTNRLLSKDVTVTVSEKDPPSQRGVHYGKVRMLSALKSNLKARLMLNASSGDKTATDNADYGYEKVKNTKRDTYIRLQFKQSQVGQSTKDATVVVQVFTKDLGNGGHIDAVESAVKIVAVPEIAATPVWIDLPHLRTTESRSTRKYVHSGQAQSSINGNSFYGLAVTVFVENEILIQEVSMSGLKNEAVTTIPASPKPDPNGNRIYYFVNQQDETPL